MPPSNNQLKSGNVFVKVVVVVDVVVVVEVGLGFVVGPLSSHIGLAKMHHGW